MTKKIKTDLLVIGAGAGGLSIAAGAAQLGVKVVLLEGDKMGGDCLNYGCVPSKALIAFSNQKIPKRFIEAMSFVREAIKEIEKANIKNILFSPGYPSGDDYINFEERGKAFNKLIEEKNGT